MKDQTHEIEATKSEGDLDWLLQHVVELANSGIPVPVTLTTAAGLVTGVAISGAEYLDLLKVDISKNWPDDMRNAYFEIVEQWQNNVYPKPAPSEETTSESFASFIHLKDARLFNAGTVVPGNGGMLWRGRLISIIGFTIGVLNPGSASEE